LVAATDALRLSSAVQATMLRAGIVRGERLNEGQILSLLLAFGGLIALLSPGLSVPVWGRAAQAVGAILPHLRLDRQGTAYTILSSLRSTSAAVVPRKGQQVTAL
jgi:drug/metabolite transporter (DMT)-like permease